MKSKCHFYGTKFRLLEITFIISNFSGYARSPADGVNCNKSVLKYKCARKTRRSWTSHNNCSATFPKGWKAAVEEKQSLDINLWQYRCDHNWMTFWEAFNIRLFWTWSRRMLTLNIEQNSANVSICFTWITRGRITSYKIEHTDSKKFLKERRKGT